MLLSVHLFSRRQWLPSTQNVLNPETHSPGAGPSAIASSPPPCQQLSASLLLPDLFPSSGAGATSQGRGEAPRPSSLLTRRHCSSPGSLWAWLSTQFPLILFLRTGGKDDKLISLPSPHAGNNCFADSRIDKTSVTLEKAEEGAIQGHCYSLLSVYEGEQWGPVCVRTMLCVISHSWGREDEK